MFSNLICKKACNVSTSCVVKRETQEVYDSRNFRYRFSAFWHDQSVVPVHASEPYLIIQGPTMGSHGEEFDEEAMSRTLRLYFKEKKPTTIGAVIEELRDLVDVKQIKAVYRCGESSEWYVAFADTSIVRSLGDGVPRHGKESIITAHRLDTRLVRFKIHWFPLHVKLEYVYWFLERFGDKIKLEYMETNYNGLVLQNGTIMGSMICTDEQYGCLPYKAVIYNKPVIITVQGRMTKCLKCNELGHTRATCPLNPKRSYAAAAAGDKDDTPARQARQGGKETEENGPPARQAREGAEKEVEKDGPPARQAREGAENESESMGPPQDTAREGAESVTVSMGPPQDIAREGASELTEEEMDLEMARMENERKRKGTDDSEDDEEEVLKKTKEEVDVEFHDPLDPSMILDLTK